MSMTNTILCPTQASAFLNFSASFFFFFRCRFRVVDSFGTEPAFNLGSYARSHGYKTLWGSWGLQPLQYMTMFRKSVCKSVSVCL